jgi:pimeloyl-ACP methyl ester carboxylesterase
MPPIFSADDPFPTPVISSVTLENKPSARLHYTYYPASSPSAPNHPNPFSTTLVVFLNGLTLPRTSWDKAITSFLQKRLSLRLPYPSLLTYDRYGQGGSDPDPDDSQSPTRDHDAMSAVHSLRQFLLQIWREHLLKTNAKEFPAIVFVCNSIGCALARLFAQTYPNTVSGLLFFDSMMANSDFVSLWPDPDVPGFDQHSLPPGVSANDVRETRAKFRESFHPSVPNAEGLSRRNIPTLLPSSSSPKLIGYGGEPPYVTVAAHEWEEFAEQCWTGSLHTPKMLTMTYLNPTWRAYHESLMKITDSERAIGVINAVGCGHYIQRDGPEFVADELGSLLDRVIGGLDQLK